MYPLEIIIISVFLSNIHFWCIKETFLLHTKHIFFYRQIFKWFINRPSSLNPMCPKFISNKQVFRKIEFSSFY